MPAKREAKRGMSAEHKASLAQGRTEGRAVRNYLDGLRATAPRRGRRRTTESVERQLAKIDDEIATADPVRQLKLVQSRRDLQAELESMAQVVDMEALEHAFVEVGRSYSERQGISYQSWREVGVPAAVLATPGSAAAGARRRVRARGTGLRYLSRPAEVAGAPRRALEQSAGGVEPVLPARLVGDAEVDDVRTAVGQGPVHRPIDGVPVVVEDRSQEVGVGDRWADGEPEHVEQLGGPRDGVGVDVPQPGAHGWPLRRVRSQVVDAGGPHRRPVVGQRHAPPGPPVPAVPGQHAQVERDERASAHARRPQRLTGLGQQVPVVGVDEVDVRGAPEVGGRPPEQVATGARREPERRR